MPAPLHCPVFVACIKTSSTPPTLYSPLMIVKLHKPENHELLALTNYTNSLQSKDSWKTARLSSCLVDESAERP